MATTLSNAVALRDALNCAIDMHLAGDVTALDLLDVETHTDVSVLTPSPAPPSIEVLSAIGDSQAAREAYVAQSNRRRAAAITLSIAAQLAGLIAPLAGQLIARIPAGGRRGAGLLVLLAILTIPACSAQVGSDSGPIVQFGPVDQPIATASVAADVDTTVDVAVNATSNVAVASPSATLTGTADFRGIGADTTAQTAHVAPTQWADGGDNRPVAIVATFSGSGWPMVIAVVAAVAVFAIAMLGEKYKILKGNARGVAQAIHDLGPSDHRDRLLTLIRQRIPVQPAWDAVVGNLDVSHTIHPSTR